MTSQPSKKKDPYAGGQSIYIVVPIVLREVCKMLQVPPQKVVDHLLWDVGRLIKVEEGFSLNKATKHFVSCGFGQETFTKDQVEQMIMELSMMLKMLPTYAGERWVKHEQFMKMRDSYVRIWRSKWQSKMKKPQTLKPNRTYHE